MKTTVETIGYMGKPRTVTGDLEAGLIVHQDSGEWMITHVASGMTPGCYGLPLKRDALRRRTALLELLPDWTGKDLEALTKAAGFASQTEFARAVKAVHDKEQSQ